MSYQRSSLRHRVFPPSLCSRIRNTITPAVPNQAAVVNDVACGHCVLAGAARHDSRDALKTGPARMKRTLQETRPDGEDRSPIRPGGEDARCPCKTREESKGF